MTVEPLIPGADRASQWYNGDGIYPGAEVFDHLDKMVWHSTEGTGWPSYSGLSTAPHFTVMLRQPGTKTMVHREVRQHFRLDRSARALQDLPDGVRPNRDFVVQAEVIAFADRSLAERYNGLFVGDMTTEDLQYLADLSVFLYRGCGIPLQVHPKHTYDDKWGLWAPQRLTEAEWLSFRGHLEHANVPENDHWDPGALDLPTIVEMARQTLDPPERVSLSLVRHAARDDLECRKTTKRRRRHVRRVEEALSAQGLLDEAYVNGRYGLSTWLAYRKWQRRHGVEPTGVPDLKSLRLLAAKHNLKVVP